MPSRPSWPTPAATATSRAPWRRRSSQSSHRCRSVITRCAPTRRRWRACWPPGRRRLARSPAPRWPRRGPRWASGRLASLPAVSLTALELDLDVFSGPFDLLLTLVLREEIDLLEVELADVVLVYLDHAEARGELDLEVATEFLVLIAALLELKSRLMLPREEEELLDVEPDVAAEELLARMLEARRYRSASLWLHDRLADEEGVRYRSAPPPAWARRASLDGLEAVDAPDRPGAAL